jgi:hypothetical protein
MTALKKMLPLVVLLMAGSFFSPYGLAEEPRSISGIYPSLSMFNNENECGTGAVVPWQDRLWVITYGPHLPFGSSDKLYEISADLRQTVRNESVGGTPANRMIHEESQQLFIGPYVIDRRANVRVIPPNVMPGRLTGNARHLTDPANKIYYATMEEGLYEVDVHTLNVTSLIRDGNPLPSNFSTQTPLSQLASQLPGYHGKGLYSSQGRLIYANNGDRDPRVTTDPTTPSGALAEWYRAGEDWQLVRRNQFTEVTGPKGILGGDTDGPVWSMGWDAKSLILMVLDEGKWHAYRLPKVSHSYDGAHGWNTEWPRIRDIGEPDLLMTMHGAFWRFPRTFTRKNPTGIRPRSAYLKVIGDFCRWKDRLVFGCDDSAKSEFLNKRKVKGGIDSVGQSQSNLWFVEPTLLDQLGPTPASGAVWLHDQVRQGEKSEPFLVAGWQHRLAWIVDHEHGKVEQRHIPQDVEWFQITAEHDCKDFSVIITLSNDDPRGTTANEIFNGLAVVGESDRRGGIFRIRGENKRTLGFATDTEYYELDGDLELRKIDDQGAEDWLRSKAPLPKDVVQLDAASILIVDDRGRRWRLPRAQAAFDDIISQGKQRICREVATERDMLNVGGTFFELPAENADGFAKIRPVASHSLAITDFGSYRGMFVLSGVATTQASNSHIVRSDDGQTSLWLGAIDDLWKLGKPVGEGGPWKEQQVAKDEVSDPYLMWGYSQRTLALSHDRTEDIAFEVELDLMGTGDWIPYTTIHVAAGAKATTFPFPTEVQARWLRVRARQACKATAWLTYR